MIKVRNAVKEDLVGVTKVQSFCFPNSFYVKLGKIHKDSLLLFNKCFLDKYSDLFYVAVNENNKVIGFVFGYEHDKKRIIRSYYKALLLSVPNPKILFFFICQILALIKNRLCSLVKNEKNNIEIVEDNIDISVMNKRTHLFYIAVLPEARGIGVAQKLLNSFWDASIKRAKPVTMLCVAKTNMRAFSFYKKNGYTIYAKLGNNDYLLIKRIGTHS